MNRFDNNRLFWVTSDTTDADRSIKRVWTCRRILTVLVFSLGFVLMAAARDVPEGMRNREWTLTEDEETRTITADYRGLYVDQVVLAVVEQTEEPEADAEEADERDVVKVEKTFDFAVLSEADRAAVLAFENTPEPRRTPEWLDGYRVRYQVYVLDDLLESSALTMMARIPTGGWLNENAGDIVAQAADGTALPVSVLSHNDHGDTLVQFRRHGYERWYWVYAVHPDAPELEAELRQRIERVRLAMQDAIQQQMALQQQVGVVAGQLRDAKASMESAQSTVARAEREIAEWGELIPQREAALEAAAGEVEPARAPVAEAEKRLEQARKTAAEAVAAQEKAEAAAAEAGTDDARAAAERAAEAAMQARMQAAGAETALQEARVELKRLEDAERSARRSLEQGRNALAEAEKLKTEQQNIAIESEAARDRYQEELKEAEQAAQAAVGEADRLREQYLEVASEGDPRLLREGMSAEFRKWEGDELSSWPAVHEGLHRSDNVYWNMFPNEIRINPALRLGRETRNFAASYRGALHVEEGGVYSFFVNSDDASFVFIDGYLVHSRTGSNPLLRGRVPVYAIGADIALDAGVYPLEVHQVVGNTPEAVGFCGLMWIPPGAERWSYVPRGSYTRALHAVPTAIEHVDGQPVAAIYHGAHDTLESEGVAMYPVSFNSAGTVGANHDSRWDFGDGLAATGLVSGHVYFEPGDYVVTLQVGDAMPPFKRRIHIGQTAVPTSARTLEQTVAVLEGMDIDGLPVQRLNQVFNFLRICEQPNRWPSMERVCRRLLEEENLDLQYRTQLHAVLMEAMARQGRAREALQRLGEAMDEAAGLRTLEAELLLQAANVHRVHLRDFSEADNLYSRILDEYRRLRHPVIRAAAVAWGDLHLAAGDTARAGEIYRLAASLGDRPSDDSAVAAAGRGAMLRIAEQQLRAGDLGQARRLLERIEDRYPEQKVEGLYRFLRGETGRLAGRYEAAIADYDVVLQLSAWAGFHGQAMVGLADTYRRMRDYDRALQWLNAVRERYPDLYEERELDEMVALIEARLERIEEIGEDVRFKQFHADFSVADDDGVDQGRFSETDLVRTMPALTLEGNTAAQLFTDDRNRNVTWQVALQDIEPEARFWVAFWYRDEFASVYAVSNPRATIDLIGPGNRRADRQTVTLVPTFGQWQKVAVDLKGPVADEVTVSVNLQNLYGLVMLDGFHVRVVSDSEHNALRSFIEGEGSGL